MRKTRDYIIIFSAGLVWDAVLSLDTILTAEYSVLGVALTTVTVTLLPYLMYEKIVENARVNWTKVFTLAVGSALGASLVTGLMGSLR